ncbi:MAG: class I SAM-dependent methyltransferase [Candidatus Omnitrophica bacterium]|nr:class I SAM-dependent methyltransferase [Candidatus Omnitrophota bacterium]
MRSKEEAKWNEAKSYMGNKRITLGPHYSYILRDLPRRLVFILSHYKFAAKIIGEGKTVLEVGCSEGFGTAILAEATKKVVGIDLDGKAIKEARRSFRSEKIEFKTIDFLGAKRIGSFDAIVAFDVIEHIYPENEEIFLKNICKNLNQYGICVIGTPNKTAEQYASPTSKISHINLYTWDRLKEAVEKYFHQVFIFSANDEIVHTGFYPMAHYLIAVGITKR